MIPLLHFATKPNFAISQALLFFVLAAVVAVGLCSTAALRRRREAAQRLPEASEVVARVSCWGGRSERVEAEKSGVGWRDAAAAATGGAGNGNAVAMSPVWQRRILMGERCEMPMFSGVILYDEHGRLLAGNSAQANQEKPVAPVTTLKELL